ncbi:MAG: helix-hairpin-helix domain-containing protein [Patescibacteria group bacterium]|nr:helix-hairpin-helix domain-containing protein [Patescibacteria group bacterium]MDE1966147.1 helix-hairpin-helix domain-containing protein [Patescibacteria group bacterium]
MRRLALLARTLIPPSRPLSERAKHGGVSFGASDASRRFGGKAAARTMAGLVCGLAPFALALALPCAGFAADLVDINTADATTLETLPHIGASLANKIIAYRTQNGPFASIGDLQKVSGIGSGSNYADIAPLITVGDASANTDSSNAANDTATTTDTAPPPSRTSGSSTYVPLPHAIVVTASGDSTALEDVPAHFSADVTTQSGAADGRARILWSFGDGSAGEGSETAKTYRYPGTYVVCATALEGPLRAESEFTVTVTRAQVGVADVTGDGVLLANGSDEEADLSEWRLVTSEGAFRLPVGTHLAPGAQVLFPWTIMNLPAAFDARLTYPEGKTAAAYAPESSASTSAAIVRPQPETSVVADASAKTQPQVPAAGFNGVHEVEPVISVAGDEAPHDTQESLAPATTTNGVAAGAPQAAAALAAGGIGRSPWFLGFLGLVVASGGALILL